VPAGRRRKPSPQRARLRRWGALGATALVATAVVLPVTSALHRAAPSPRTTAAAPPPAPVVKRAAARSVSRDFARPTPAAARMAIVNRLVDSTPAPPPQHLTLRTRWATAPLRVVAAPADSARRVTGLRAGVRVRVTGTVHGPWAQVSLGGRLVWVHRAFLSATKPSTTQAFASSGGGSVSAAPCPDGTAVESGLVTHTVEVYRAVCAAFPAVTTWGGRSGSGGDHGSGHALDIMCTSSLGDAISAYVRAHASELGVSYVIWSQHIWSVQRSSEGWRAMPDRGSTTANHYDHVHVSVY
jgi:hypothetical protein